MGCIVHKYVLIIFHWMRRCQLLRWGPRRFADCTYLLPSAFVVKAGVGPLQVIIIAGVLKQQQKRITKQFVQQKRLQNRCKAVGYTKEVQNRCTTNSHETVEKVKQFHTTVTNAGTAHRRHKTVRKIVTKWLTDWLTDWLTLAKSCFKVRTRMSATRPQRKMTIMNALKMENRWIRCSKKSLIRYVPNRLENGISDAIHSTCIQSEITRKKKWRNITKRRELNARLFWAQRKGKYRA